MISKEYDSECLSIREAASVLEVDSSLVSRLFREGRLHHYENSNRKHFTTETDIQNYLSSRLPSGFVAMAESEHLSMR